MKRLDYATVGPNPVTLTPTEVLLATALTLLLVLSWTLILINSWEEPYRRLVRQQIVTQVGGGSVLLAGWVSAAALTVAVAVRRKSVIWIFVLAVIFVHIYWTALCPLGYIDDLLRVQSGNMP